MGIFKFYKNFGNVKILYRFDSCIYLVLKAFPRYQI